MIVKEVKRREFVYRGPPPSAWFWKEHRIPRELQNLEEGKNYGFGYLSSWGINWGLPNARDRIKYLQKLYR